MLKMFKSESMDGDPGGDSLGLGDLGRNPKSRLFRRSVTVPSEMLSSSVAVDDNKLLDMVRPIIIP